MPKGIFTQGVCVLLDRAVSLDELESALAGFDLQGRRESAQDWMFGGPTLVLSYRPECDGLVCIDTVNQPWPDHMGDAESDTMVFGAWALGHFGPFTYPGGLERAAQQCWAWDGGKATAERHSGFIRIRSSYAMGGKLDAAVLPSDYEALPELEFVTKVASALLELPGALCYFNPNGEVLRDQDGLRESLNYAWTNEFPPLDVWANVRLFNVNAEWSLMDTVGNAQLDIPDSEACFHSDSYDLDEVNHFLRNVSLYLLNSGDVIDDGDTMDGPGGIRWQAQQLEEPACAPPRPVLRWRPLDERPLPVEIQASEEAD